MSLSINDFFKYPLILDRLHNCGYLSSYLNPFVQWMAKRQFADVTIRSHISNVAHLSQSLKGIEEYRRYLDNFNPAYFSKLIPSNRCWPDPFSKRCNIEYP